MYSVQQVGCEGRSIHSEEGAHSQLFRMGKELGMLPSRNSLASPYLASLHFSLAFLCSFDPCLAHQAGKRRLDCPNGPMTHLFISEISSLSNTWEGGLS